MASSDSASAVKRGTIILTGANGALGTATVRALLERFSTYFLVLTVRDDTKSDTNTASLRNLIAGFPACAASIESLDLSSLANVRAFSQSVAKRVATKQLKPISAIICNAFTWSLIDTRLSKDNYELTFHVTHLSHFLLVLILLDSMDKLSSRVVFVGSVVHDETKKNFMNPNWTGLPDELEELVEPTAEVKGQAAIVGFRRYANSKFANIMMMHTLNRRLQQNPELQHISATAIDPGPLPDSKAMRNATLPFRTAMYIVAGMVKVYQYATNYKLLTAESGCDLASLALNPEKDGVQGYFVSQKEVLSSPKSRDKDVQEKLWTACIRWAGLAQEETILGLA